MPTYYDKADTGFGNPSMAHVLMPQTSFAQIRADKEREFSIINEMAILRQQELARQNKYEQELMDKLSSIKKNDYLEPDKKKLLAFIDIEKNKIRDKIKNGYIGNESAYIENQLQRDIQDALSNLNRTDLLSIAEMNKINKGIIDEDEKKDKEFRDVQWEEIDRDGSKRIVTGTAKDNVKAYALGKTDKINYNGSYNMPKNITEFYAKTLDPNVTRRLNEDPMQRSVSPINYYNDLRGSGMSDDDAKDAMIKYERRINNGLNPHFYAYDSKTANDIKKAEEVAKVNAQKQANKERELALEAQRNNIAQQRANIARQNANKNGRLIDLTTSGMFSTHIGEKILEHASNQENKGKPLSINISDKEAFLKSAFGDKKGNAVAGRNVYIPMNINEKIEAGDDGNILGDFDIKAFNPTKIYINDKGESYAIGTGTMSIEQAIKKGIVTSNGEGISVANPYRRYASIKDDNEGVELNSIGTQFDIDKSFIESYEVQTTPISKNPNNTLQYLNNQQEE